MDGYVIGILIINFLIALDVASISRSLKEIEFMLEDYTSRIKRGE